jgi:hypothetical protein
VLAGVAACIVTFGAGGEILAVYALYQQAESGSERTVLISVIILILATAAGPAVAYVRFYFFHTSPGDKAQPEPDKTDAPPPAPGIDE